MKYTASLLLLLLVANLEAFDHYPANRGVDVIAYNFSIYLSDSYDLIRGEAGIRVIHTVRTSEIMLDLVGKGEDGKGMSVEAVTVDDEVVLWFHSDDKLIIKLTGDKIEGETSRVSVKYFGIPGDGLIISKNRYGDRTFFADNWPDRARNWIPCVDHPSDKAKVEFMVYTPYLYKVVSNGIMVEESMLDEGVKLTHWKEETSISTKVMVIGVARFASQLAGKIGGIDIWTYVFPEDREKGFGDYAIASEPFIFFSDAIGSYPYEKLANVQSKTMFGGMENAGCIFYSERSVTGKNGVERLMTHEIAHQWFGNSVTELDWHHIWLSEGFATYFTSFYMENKYGKERMISDMIHSRNRVIRAFENNPAPVIDTTITDFMRLLNTYSYQKGAWVLHMLREEVGESDFITGIRTYYSRYRNQNALTSDFQKTMEDISGRELDQFFYQWLYLPDLPVLRVSWDYNSRRDELMVTVTQQQENNLFVLPVEIEIVSKGVSRIEKVRLDSRSATLTLRAESAPDAINLDPGVKLLFVQYPVAE